MGIWAAVGVMAVCFVVLSKCASWFVDGAVGLAEYLNVPKMLIGIVLVSLATTAPELAVSMMSALGGYPEMALGNAVGSVIVDDGVALGLGALLAAKPIVVNPFLLKTTGLFILAIDVIAYLMVLDGTLGRVDGSVLVVLFAAYLVFAYITRKRSAASETPEEVADIEDEIKGKSLGGLMVWFGIGLAGVLVSSHYIVDAAVAIASFLGVGEAVIGLTIVAVGTSLPEVATSIMSVRKGHGEIVVGNILGADILNICWIAGASALANPLVVHPRIVHFSFPIMLVIVASMLIMMRTRHRLARGEGIFLLGLYVVYVLMAMEIFL